jgi:hypothetical protein
MDETLAEQAVGAVMDFMNEGPDKGARLEAYAVASGTITRMAIDLWAEETGQDAPTLARRVAAVWGQRGA